MSNLGQIWRAVVTGRRMATASLTKTTQPSRTATDRKVAKVLLPHYPVVGIQTFTSNTTTARLIDVLLAKIQRAIGEPANERLRDLQEARV
jgi:hypothetical protein